MRVVVALGGNALLQRGEAPEVVVQRRNARRAAAAIAELAKLHEVIVTHGNGPQVGLLAMRSETSGGGDPLDVVDAETEGLIGYLLEQELRNALPDQELATVLTQTVVDRDDPAFQQPTKFVGPRYADDEAETLIRQRAWQMARDGGYLRRVVASPKPRRILEREPISLLVEAGVIVIAAGGGGIPVLETDGGVEGVEAVVDKDLASALLAQNLGADALLMLTDVDAVYVDWGTADQRPLADVGVDELDSYRFPAGSMGPKIEAACQFARHGGLAAIGALGDAAAILLGEKGTRVTAA